MGLQTTDFREEFGAPGMSAGESLDAPDGGDIHVLFKLPLPLGIDPHTFRIILVIRE